MNDVIELITLILITLSSGLFLLPAFIILLNCFIGD